MEFTCAIVSILLIPLVSIYNEFSGGPLQWPSFSAKTGNFTLQLGDSSLQQTYLGQSQSVYSETSGGTLSKKDNRQYC